jgi:hypothetical protein
MLGNELSSELDEKKRVSLGIWDVVALQMRARPEAGLHCVVK